MVGPTWARSMASPCGAFLAFCSRTCHCGLPCSSHCDWAVSASVRLCSHQVLRPEDLLGWGTCQGPCPWASRMSILLGLWLPAAYF